MQIESKDENSVGENDNSKKKNVSKTVRKRKETNVKQGLVKFKKKVEEVTEGPSPKKSRHGRILKPQKHRYAD